MIASRRSGKCVRFCLVILALATVVFVCGPILYWRLYRGFNGGVFSSSCPVCSCDCPPPLSIQKLPPGLDNLTTTDCGKNDPELSKEMEKQLVDILAEELKLQEAVDFSRSRQMNYSILETKRLASQYQKEAEKCNAATETCEEARERAEASLTREKVNTALWERRARLLGWQER